MNPRGQYLQRLIAQMTIEIARETIRGELMNAHSGILGIQPRAIRPKARLMGGSVGGSAHFPNKRSVT